MSAAPKRVRKRAGRGGPDSPESARTAKVGSLRLASETWAALDAYAAREGLSRSAAVAKLVSEHAGEK